MILKNKEKIGILQGRLTKQKKKIQQFPANNWEKEFQMINNLKIQNMEWTVDNYGYNKNPLNLEHKHKKIKSLCKKNKIKINSVTADFFMEKPFWKNRNKSYYLKKIEDLIINCSKLKIKYIILPLVDNSSLKNLRQQSKVIRELKKFGAILKKKKVEILFESDFNPKKLLKFIKLFNNSSFGINYDSGNSANLGFNVLNEFNAYGKYIKNIHIKDRLKYGPSVRLGYGDVKFIDLFNQIKKIKYKGIFIFQSARSKIKGNDIEEIKLNLKFLERFL